jgi:hypothetical protein
MDNSQIQFIQSTPGELKEQILKGVLTELKELKEHLQPKIPEELLSRQQTADLLKVDLSTIHNWSVQGKLIKYGFGGKVYYKRSEIEAKIIPINTPLQTKNSLQ